MDLMSYQYQMIPPSYNNIHCFYPVKTEIIAVKSISSTKPKYSELSIF